MTFLSSLTLFGKCSEWDPPQKVNLDKTKTFGGLATSMVNNSREFQFLRAHQGCFTLALICRPSDASYIFGELINGIVINGSYHLLINCVLIQFPFAWQVCHCEYSIE